MMKKAVVVSFDAGIRDIVSEFLRSQGYCVVTRPYISQVCPEEDAVVIYHNRFFTVHHLMNTYQVLSKAQLIFMGDFRGMGSKNMVHVPFTIASLEEAIGEVA
jgi:aspartyl/asparaginyl-tRNA synthetase